jgi:DNA-binding CsgD family transcriptional regulator
LEVLEDFEGAEVEAVGGIDTPLNAGKGIEGVVVGLAEGGIVLDGFVNVLAVGEGLVQAFDAVVPEVGFDAAEAALGPLGGDEGIDERELGCAGGVVFEEECRGEGFERLMIHLLRNIDARKQTEALTKEITVLVGRLTGQPAERLLEPVRAPAPTVDLTPQERKILYSLSRGVSTAGIGRELNVTPATVRNHVQHILRKLRVHTRLQAVLRAAREGLF